MTEIDTAAPTAADRPAEADASCSLEAPDSLSGKWSRGVLSGTPVSLRQLIKAKLPPSPQRLAVCSAAQADSWHEDWAAGRVPPVHDRIGVHMILVGPAPKAVSFVEPTGVTFYPVANMYAMWVGWANGRPSGVFCPLTVTDGELTVLQGMDDTGCLDEPAWGERPSQFDAAADPGSTYAAAAAYRLYRAACVVLSDPFSAWNFAAEHKPAWQPQIYVGHPPGSTPPGSPRTVRAPDRDYVPLDPSYRGGVPLFVRAGTVGDRRAIDLNIRGELIHYDNVPPLVGWRIDNS